MGNGQCPECCGVSEKWYGDYNHAKKGDIGHKKKCDLASSINELGGNAILKGDFKSDIEYEVKYQPGKFPIVSIKSQS